MSSASGSEKQNPDSKDEKMEFTTFFLHFNLDV